MATSTFTGGDEFIVPAENSQVTIRCYGGKGQDGTANGQPLESVGVGGNGALVEGVLNVSPGDRLYIREISGARGGSASYSSNEAEGGDGGNAILVRYGGDSVDDIVIGAGGGGGGGAAASDDWEGGDTDTGGGGGGGGSAQDGDNASTGNTSASGGTGGGSSSKTGSSGSTNSDGHADVGAAAAGGGGGAGWNGGTGGGASAYAPYTDTYAWEEASGAGGGGGDGYTGGVYSTSVTIGQNSSGAYVEIEYTPTPRTPTLADITFDAEVPETYLDWSLTSDIVDGYYVYRGTASGFALDSNHRVANITNGGVQSYTDQGIVRGTQYYYVVTAYESSSGNESDGSNEETVLVAAYIEVYEDGSWVSKPVRYWDENDQEWKWPTAVKQYNADTDTWETTSNR